MARPGKRKVKAPAGDAPPRARPSGIQIHRHAPGASKNITISAAARYRLRVFCATREPPLRACDVVDYLILKHLPEPGAPAADLDRGDPPAPSDGEGCAGGDAPTVTAA